jgi:hypothetical protein
MKIIKILFGMLTLVLVLVYIVLFTSVNKSVVVPIIENKISQASEINSVKIPLFDLSFNSFKMKLLIEDQTIDIDSTFDIFKRNVDLKYNIDISNLGKFDHITGQKMRGSFKSNGSLKGSFEHLKLAGDAKVANGDISYSLNIDQNDINTIKADIVSVDLAALLNMIYQPMYAKADLNLDIDIKSLKDLNGKIVTSLSDGILNKKVIKKDFNISLPSNATFDLRANTNLDKNLIKTKTLLKTFALNLKTENTIFDTSTAILSSDYLINIPKLSKLFFITKQKMKGNLNINGDMKYKDDLEASFNSKKFNGTINGTLIKDEVKVDIKNLNSLKLLDMLYYPKIYNSTVNLNLAYNLKSQKGKSNLVMYNGQFLTNQLSETIKKFIKKDLTKEIYRVAKVNTIINKQKLYSDIYMESKNSKIKSDKIFIDLDKNIINTDIDLIYYKYKVGVNLTDKLTKPKVKFNLNNVVKSKVQEKINKVIEKRLGDKLNDKTKKMLGGFINKLF